MRVPGVLKHAERGRHGPALFLPTVLPLGCYVTLRLTVPSHRSVTW